MNPSPLVCDVVIVGSGPAGSTAARELARAKVDVLLIEKAIFPRFQIGESFLPYNLELLAKLGLESRLRQLPHTVKRGAEFGMGGGLDTTVFYFHQSMSGHAPDAFNLARSHFDRMLQDAAVEAGARTLTPAIVKEILELRDGHVRLRLADDREVHARYLIDATGQATLVGKHLKWRRTASESHLRKTAYFEQFTHVKRLQGEDEGVPAFAMCKEGWFWIIPLDETTTSVGIVLEPHIAREVGVSADRMLAWGIARCPLIRDRMQQAVGPVTNQVRADFSYDCAPYAGDGFFLVGDAAMFMDPVFSTGVCGGMTEAVEVSRLLVDILGKKTSPAAARRTYERYVSKATYWFSRLIRMFYNPHFRELFLEGQGPLEIHKAVIAILAGYVFPSPEFRVKWRFRLFELFIVIQRFKPLAPRQQVFSLLSQPTPTAGS